MAVLAARTAGPLWSMLTRCTACGGSGYMSDEQHDELLGRYIRLTRRIAVESNAFGAEVSAFIEALKPADRRQAGAEAVRLDVAQWMPAMQRLIDKSQSLTDLAAQVNAIAKQIREPEVPVVTPQLPRFF